jgi:hypothetical protein
MLSELFEERLMLPQDPIFIVGYPRSGTTLLQALLAAQEGIYSFPETHYFCVIEKHIRLDVGGTIAPECLAGVYRRIYDKMELHFTAKEAAELYHLAQGKQLTSKRLFESIVIALLKKQTVDTTAYRWLEKTPYHANHLSRIVEFYPAAQILHILRHPVPAILSRKAKFPFNQNTALVELARQWNRIQLNVEHFREQFPAQVHTLTYESLAADPANGLVDVGDFLRIKFDAARLPAAVQISVQLILPFETWKQDDREKEIVNTNDAYRDTCNRKDVELIESIVGDLMHRYCYRPYLHSGQECIR